MRPLYPTFALNRSMTSARVMPTGFWNNLEKMYVKCKPKIDIKILKIIKKQSVKCVYYRNPFHYLLDTPTLLLAPFHTFHAH